MAGTLGGHILLLELVPERNFALAILTNANNGWRLIQDVERAALKSYRRDLCEEPGDLAPRSGRDAPAVEPLRRSPTLRRNWGWTVAPRIRSWVRSETAAAACAGPCPTQGDPQSEMPIAFYGPDRAVVTDGPDRGQSIELVRDATGSVKWIRVVGRIAVRIS